MFNTPGNIDILLEHITSLLTSRYDLILLSELGISYSQYKVLVQFKNDSIVRQKTIAKSLGQTEASISRQIKIMSLKGLVHKSYDPEDRKSIIITLTQDGKAVKSRADNVITKENVTSLYKINPKDQKTLIKNLNKIHDHICIASHNH